MKRLTTLMMMLGLAGCGSGTTATPNPSQLWLALAGDELHGRLVDHEPPPY